MKKDVVELLRLSKDGHEGSLGKLISLIEKEDRAALRYLHNELSSTQSRGYTIAISGPPGVGKSTLLGQLAKHVRNKGHRPALVLVDPSSSISGGSFLGDRLRMRELGSGSGVFIRSIAARKGSRSLSPLIGPILRTLASVYDRYVFVETVGIGQVDSESPSAVDLFVLVLGPDSGDVFQLLKAGVLEAADIVVVNKSDQAGSKQLMRNLRMLRQDPSTSRSAPIMLPVVSTADQGIAELLEEIDSLLRRYERSGELTRRREEARMNEFRHVMASRLSAGILEWVERSDEAVDSLKKGEADPYLSAVEIAERVSGQLSRHDLASLSGTDEVPHYRPE